MGHNKEDRAALELRIRKVHDTGDMGAAAEVAIAGYGPEIFGFLMAQTHNEDVASEVFAQFLEHVWKGLPNLAWRSSFRTWAYTVVWNTYRMYLRDPHLRRAQPFVTGQLSRVAAEVRESTLPYLRKTVKNRFTELRERLEPEQRTLLILRVDRKMSWTEVAEVMAEPGTDERELRKEAGRLRQRFKRLKEELRRMAQEEGLFD